MARSNARRKALIAALILTSGLALQGWAAGAGEVTHLSGLLTVKRGDGSSKVLSVKSEVQQGDTLATEQDTYARIKFVDGAEVVMRPGTQLKVESYNYDVAKPEADNAFFSLLKGGFRAVTGLLGKRNHDKVNFSTPTATIGIRGTNFGALFCQSDCGGVQTPSGQPPANGLHVDVASGAVVVSNGAGQVQVNTGQFAYVQNPNSSPTIVPPKQGIQVTMPTNISQNKGSLSNSCQ